jgi:hypothetical protein
MNNTREVSARIAIANFETRQSKENAAKRSRYWRFVFLISQIVVGIGLSVYIQVSHWQISGAQACGFFLIYFAGTAWGNYRARETIHSLQSELARLKDTAEKNSTLSCG